MIFAAWVLGQVVRDLHWITGLCFYIPSPILVVGLACGSLVELKLKRKTRSNLLILVTIAPIYFIGVVENHFIQPLGLPVQDKPQYKLIHWNVFSAHLGWESVKNKVIAEAADIYFLTEVKDLPLEEFKEALGEDYQLRTFSDLAILARGELEGGEWLNRSKKLKVFKLSWKFDGNELILFPTDLGSNPLFARHPNLTKLNKFMEEQQPDFVVGDFNAPRRSIALESMPKGYYHAYDRVGKGWGYTWPQPFPVLAIDQCILSDQIHPVSYQLGGDWVSDHRMQKFEFQILDG